jgi:hypothetical protein
MMKQSSYNRATFRVSARERSPSCRSEPAGWWSLRRPSPPGRAVLPASALAARDGSRISGVVTANDEPVRESTVTLLAAGQSPGTATVVDTVTTDRRGGFTVTVPRTVCAGAGRWGGAPRPGPEVELAASLGDIRSGGMVVNERAMPLVGTPKQANDLAQWANKPRTPCSVSA